VVWSTVFSDGCVEDIDYKAPRGIDKSVIFRLAGCDWIRSAQNIIVTGPTGVGKTYLACALANRACRMGFSAFYIRIEPIEKVYADKGYFGKLNRIFLNLNEIKDGVMRKNTRTAKLTDTEIKRNKKISKKRYIVEQYFGLSHLHDGAYRARFTTILKNLWDTMCRQMAFNIRRGTKLMKS